MIVMRAVPALLAILSLAACNPSGAGEDANAVVPPVEEAPDLRAEFLAKAAGDAWVNWPAGLQGDPADDGEQCVRVTEHAREAAIKRLAQHPAIGIDRKEYEQLTGAAAPTGDEELYLLRGFSTNNSAARVKVIGDAVTVHSDALGGFYGLRRHPCIASLTRPPSAVYTVAAYDL